MKKAKINELRKVASWWGDTLSVALPGLATYGIARGLGAGNGLALGLGAAAGGAGLYAKKQWLDPAWERAELETNAKEERAALTAAAKEYEEREASEAAADENAAREAAEEYEAREAASQHNPDHKSAKEATARVLKQYPYGLPFIPAWARTNAVKDILNPANHLDMRRALQEDIWAREASQRFLRQISETGNEFRR